MIVLRFSTFAVAAIAIVFIAMTAPGCIAQQSSPSLDETAGWLTNVYAGHGTFEYSTCENCVAREVVSLAITGCSARMTSNVTMLNSSGVDRSYVRITEVQLGRLDPSRAKSHTNRAGTSAGLDISATDGRKSVTVTTSQNGSSKVESFSDFPFLLPLGDYTERVAKAWVHAIELCGGKSSAF
jgi:hypothetical protein